MDPSQLTPEPDFELTLNDRVPVLELELKGADGKALLLPVGSSAKWRMWRDGSYASPKINDVDLTIVSQRATPDDLVTKTVVKFAWRAGDTDTAGVWFGRVRGALSTGESYTVPNGVGEYVRVLISQPT